MRNIYGIYEGSTLDLFIKSVSKNVNHSKYNELKEKYPLYYTELKPILNQIKQNLIQQIKENIYQYQVEKSIMDYYEVGQYGFWIDYTCDIAWVENEPSEKDEMRINNLEVEVREVWSSNNNLLRNVTNLINKL